MICDCLVRKFPQNQPVGSIGITVVKFECAVKILFDKSQVFFASKTARGFGEFGGDCVTSENNLMKQ